MRSLNRYINEKFQVGKDNINKKYAYYPKDKCELIAYIKEKIDKEGLGTKDEPLDLNDIDTSKVTDMSYLFDIADGELNDLSKKGNFDISDWDVSHVTDMTAMFAYSAFNGDISDWNVSNVKYMKWMFWKSNFNSDLSKWNVSNVKSMMSMFRRSKFSGDISYWDVSNVKNMQCMFEYSPIEKNPPRWYKEK